MSTKAKPRKLKFRERDNAKIAKAKEEKTPKHALLVKARSKLLEWFSLDLECTLSLCRPALNARVKASRWTRRTGASRAKESGLSIMKKN